MEGADVMDIEKMIDDYRAQHPDEAALADAACKDVKVSFAKDATQVFSLKDVEVN